ncbi:MAG: hypothetical protein IV107_00655 [Paucibacter sp.]|nr:hypothetical protein [Roseateles sp.]
MNPWRLDDTYALVKRAFGHKQETMARASIRSITDRQSFARYHYHEAQRLTQAFVRAHLAEDDDMLIDVLSQEGQKKRIAFERYIFKAGAHATAAIQSLHSVPDILANGIYFSAGQNLRPNPLPERDLSLPKIAKALARESMFGSLASMLREAQTGAGWSHLAAVCNLSKHRTVIRMAMSEDLTGTREERRELHVSGFERDGKWFPSLSLKAVVAPEYDRLSPLICSIGHELNNKLRAIAAKPLVQPDPLWQAP